MRSLLICLSIFVFSACSDSSSGENNISIDAGADQRLEDMKSSSDMTQKDTRGLDATRDLANDGSQDGSANDMTAADMSKDLADTSTEDVRADMADPFPGRPKGQCRQKSDCPDQPNADCGSIPGGVCLNCGIEDSNCPGDAVCSQFGACIVECQNENECAPGLRCTARGRCAAERCVQGVCPIPAFGCTNSGLCERKPCADDPNVCNNGTICIEGRCVLDR